MQNCKYYSSDQSSSWISVQGQQNSIMQNKIVFLTSKFSSFLSPSTLTLFSKSVVRIFGTGKHNLLMLFTECCLDHIDIITDMKCHCFPLHPASLLLPHPRTEGFYFFFFICKYIRYKIISTSQVFFRAESSLSHHLCHVSENSTSVSCCSFHPSLSDFLAEKNLWYLDSHNSWWSKHVMVLLCKAPWSEDQMNLDDLWRLLYLPCMYDSAKLIASSVSRQESDEKKKLCIFHNSLWWLS